MILIMSSFVVPTSSLFKLFEVDVTVHVIVELLEHFDLFEDVPVRNLRRDERHYRLS